MEEPVLIQHATADHATITRVQWALGGTEGLSDLTMINPSFVTDLVHHYQVVVGKSLFVEFIGAELDQVSGLPGMIQQLTTQGVRTGLYLRHQPDVEFWSSIGSHLTMAVLVFDVATHSVDTLVNSLGRLHQNAYCHIIVEFTRSDLFPALSAVKQIATKCKNISLNMKLTTPMAELTDSDRAQIDGAQALAKRATFKNRSIIPVSFRGAMRVVYPPEQSVIMTTAEIIAHNLNHWAGWTCSAGLETLVIYPNGDIYRGWCKQGKKVGNLNDQLVAFPATSVICQALTCSSSVDISNSKSWY